MIQVDNISKEYPDGVLFSDVSFQIKKGMRIGLVGPNGSGKTTLLRIMLGVETPDTGSIIKEKNISIGYLPQDIIVGSKVSILDEVLNSFPLIRDIEREMSAVSHKIKEEPENNKLLRKLGELQQRFDGLGGWTIDKKAKEILGGLGFSEEQFEKHLDTFSGGWRMRVALAGILLKNPDILFLDEPTNHLDLDATIWLENFLSEWRGSLVMISHDRKFLDRSVNNILEIDRSSILSYKGNYSKYLELKQIRIEQQQAAYNNQQDKIAQTKRFIERFRYKNTKAKQVQSKIKQLERMDLIEEPFQSQRKIHVNIPQPERRPLKVATLKNAGKRYGDIEVYNNLNLEIERGQSIGLVGHNGAGKSTLLKMLAGVEKITSGSLSFGSKVSVAYFAQHQLEILDPNLSVFENIRKVSKNKTEPELRSFLGSFLFTGDEVDKLVKVLSGGERSRLALAKILISPANLLLLDEPTNHLDITSRDVVEAALKQYEGTIVCISHDRHFLNEITNLTYEVGKGGVTVYTGNYDYYIWKKEDHNSSPINKSENNTKKSKPKSNYQEQKKTANRIRVLERKIAETEKIAEKFKQELSNPSIASDYEKIQKLLNKVQETEEQYFKYLEELEELQTQ